MSRCTTALCCLLALALAACPGKRSETGLHAPQAEPEAPAPTARLVVVVVLDQMPSEALIRYAPYLSEEGALRRAMARGLHHERVRYSYAGTNTAPGHTSIHTGELPADHGIDSNDVFDYESGERIKIVVDGEHEVFGSEESSASPYRLRKPTVGDLLKKADPASKVVSVSLKARAAVVSGGHSADFAAWYDAKLGLFTSSSYYGEALPSWLEEWNAANPVSARIGEWSTENAELYERLLGADDAPGEANWYGLGTTFPHAADKTEKPQKTFVATPQSAEYLIDLSRAAVEAYELGADEHPDLLALSISSTDYAGHSYGWQSWEYLDVLIKADLALGQLLSELEESTDLAVLITSDHGGTPLAETRIAAGLPGGRVMADVLVETLEGLADKELGAGDWVQAYIQPYLWLTKSAKESDKRDALVALIEAYAAGAEELELVVPPERARSWRGSEDALKSAIANTVAADSEGLFVVPAEGYVASPGRGAGGTGHGTPWDMDREVQVLAYGTGVSIASSTEVLPQERVAATIASLLGLPWQLAYKPLPGAPTR